jgi:hypothetical protein
MRFNVDWTFFLEVTTQQKCEKLLDQVSQSLGFPFSNLKIEPYWKERGTFKVIAQSSFDAPAAKDGLFDIMMLLNRLASTWVVKAPTLEDLWTFSGMAQPETLRIQGIKSITFESTAQATQAPMLVDSVAAHT